MVPPRAEHQSSRYWRYVYEGYAMPRPSGHSHVPCWKASGQSRAAETGLRGWGERTRTRKCLFFVISAELLGFTQHFRTRDFSRTPGRDRFRSRRVKATFASSSPICPATQYGLCGEEVAPATCGLAHAQQGDRVRRMGALMVQAAEDPEGQARLAESGSRRSSVNSA